MSAINGTHLTPTYTSLASDPIPNRVDQSNSEPKVKKLWYERLIAQLNENDQKLDKAIPDYAFQKKVDQIVSEIEQQFATFDKFNKWCDDNGKGEWNEQLAISLAKLPLKAVRNILRLLGSIIKGAIYAATHPLKALNHIAKLLILLVEELTKPETWSKIGAGVVGASLGHSLASGNPFSIMGVGIGAAMLLGGLAVGNLKSILKAQEGSEFKAAGKHLLSEAKQLPEALLTGFCMGLLMGGIQRGVRGSNAIAAPSSKAANYQEAKKVADAFIAKHKLPEYASLELGNAGQILVRWEGAVLQTMRQLYPELFTHSGPGTIIYLSCKIELSAASHLEVVGSTFYSSGNQPIFTDVFPLEKLGIHPAHAHIATLTAKTTCPAIGITPLFHSAIGAPILKSAPIQTTIEETEADEAEGSDDAEEEELAGV